MIQIHISDTLTLFTTNIPVSAKCEFPSELKSYVSASRGRCNERGGVMGEGCNGNGV